LGGSVQAIMPQSNVDRAEAQLTPSKNAGSQSLRPRFRRQRLDADCLTPLYPFLPDTALAVGCSPGQAESPVPTPQSQEFGWIAFRRVASVLLPLVASHAGQVGGEPICRPVAHPGAM
jgi:hypothetical protein